MRGNPHRAWGACSSAELFAASCRLSGSFQTQVWSQLVGVVDYILHSLESVSDSLLARRGGTVWAGEAAPSPRHPTLDALTAFGGLIHPSAGPLPAGDRPEVHAAGRQGMHRAPGGHPGLRSSCSPEDAARHTGDWVDSSQAARAVAWGARAAGGSPWWWEGCVVAGRRIKGGCTRSPQLAGRAQSRSGPWLQQGREASGSPSQLWGGARLYRTNQVVEVGAPLLAPCAPAQQGAPHAPLQVSAHAAASRAGG